jgi:hypothetical protein
VAARRDGVGALVVALEHPLGLLVSVNHPPAEPADEHGDACASFAGASEPPTERCGDHERTATVWSTTPDDVAASSAIDHRFELKACPSLCRRPLRREESEFRSHGHHADRRFGRSHRRAWCARAGATATGGLAGRRRTTEPLRGIGIKPSCDEGRWIGEAGVRRTLDVPMLSLSGAGVHFHTPADLPDAVTSPQTLEAVTAALAAVAVDLQVAAATADSRS